MAKASGAHPLLMSRLMIQQTYNTSMEQLRVRGRRGGDKTIAPWWCTRVRGAHITPHRFCFMIYLLLVYSSNAAIVIPSLSSIP